MTISTKTQYRLTDLPSDVHWARNTGAPNSDLPIELQRLGFNPQGVVGDSVPIPIDAQGKDEFYDKFIATANGWWRFVELI